MRTGISDVDLFVGSNDVNECAVASFEALASHPLVMILHSHSHRCSVLETPPSGCHDYDYRTATFICTSNPYS